MSLFWLKLHWWQHHIFSKEKFRLGLLRYCVEIVRIIRTLLQDSSSGFDNCHTSRTYVRLLLLAYAWFWTCVRWGVRSFFLLWFIKIFKIFELYLFVLGRERVFSVNIYFKETLFSNFSYKLFNKYFSLLQSTCQFRLSVSKITGIVLGDSESWITNRFWYVLNRKQHFLNLFMIHK